MCIYIKRGGGRVGWKFLKKPFLSVDEMKQGGGMRWDVELR